MLDPCAQRAPAPAPADAAPALTARARTAHGDLWRAEGLLRTRGGGGACELPGIRLMASGLPHAQWNNGDVTDPEQVDLAAVRAWFATRGVPWGVRIPAGLAWPHGRFLFRKRVFAFEPAAFRPAPAIAGVRVRVARGDDAERVAALSAAAFAGTINEERAWVAPHLGAAGFRVAVAELSGVAVGVAAGVITEDRAGPCVGVLGLAVHPDAASRGIGTALASLIVAWGFEGGATLAHGSPGDVAAVAVAVKLGALEVGGFDVYLAPAHREAP